MAFHPVQAVSDIAGTYGAGISAASELYSAFSSDSGQALRDIGTGYGMSYNEFASKSSYEQGKSVGKSFGELDFAVALMKAGKTGSGSKAENTIKDGSVRTQRNGYLAGKSHPVTGIPFDKSGYPNFSSVSKMDVQIDFTGSRLRDTMTANKLSGFDRTPAGYVWHHHQDGQTLQLVPRDIHVKTGHDGGFAGN
jgi:hypothetical protein